jgi:transposase
MKTTAAAKVKRDARVVADRARGLRWATIAERQGLSETMCRKIWRERRSGEDFRSLRPAEVVDETVAQLESVVEELAQLAASTRNDAVRLGAIKARAATLIQRLELLQALGRVPVAPRLRWEIGMEFTANAVLAIFDRYEVPHAATQELIDALRSDPIGFEAPGRRLALINGN